MNSNSFYILVARQSIFTHMQTKWLGYLSFFGGIVIALLGIIILLIEGDTGERPHELTQFTLFLVFAVGLILIIYLIKNRGIG